MPEYITNMQLPHQVASSIVILTFACGSSSFAILQLPIRNKRLLEIVDCSTDLIYTTLPVEDGLKKWYVL